MADNSFRLRIKTADGNVKTVDFTWNTVIIGSGEDAGVLVNDNKVGELHLRLRLKDGQFFATDLNTDEGTTLDGQKVSKDVPVKPGQSLKLGGTTITIESTSADTSSAARPATSGKSTRKGSTDGNAARALNEEDEAQPAKVAPTVSAPKTGKSVPGKIAASTTRDRDWHNGADPRLKDYAARFLSDELPESMKPTPGNKRLQVAMLWGKDQFLDVKDMNAGQSLTAGDGHGATFPLYHAALRGVVPVVQPEGDGFRILLPAGANPRVLTDGKDVSLEQLISSGKAKSIDIPVKGGSFTIGLNDRVNLQLDTLQIIARYTKPQNVKTRPLGERIDINFISTLVILLLIALAFERMIAITDFSGWNTVDDLFKNKDRLAKYIAALEQKEKPKDQLSGVKEGAKPKGDEGKFGKKEAEKPKAAPSKAGAPVVDKNQREEDRKKVASAGLLDAFAKDQAAVSDQLGPGGIGTGINTALGGIDGTAGLGDASGMGGLGARGGGSGGGGTGLGIGGLGGHGTGRGRGGNGQFDLGGKGKGTTQFIPGRTTVLGGLSADEIGRVVKRHWNEIKYCYEKELNKDPNLAGKVGLAWEIGPVGDVTVAAVRETDLHNSNAEDCMVASVRRWKFPAPRGGGVVNVNYPFIFQPQ